VTGDRRLTIRSSGPLRISGGAIMRYCGSGRLAQALGFMVKSPSQSSTLRRSSKPISWASNIKAVLPIAAVVGAYIVFSLFRTPVGSSHNVEGVVIAIGKSPPSIVRRIVNVTASVRLSSGAVVLVDASGTPYVGEGSMVVLREQPIRFGPPVYSFAQ